MRRPNAVVRGLNRVCLWFGDFGPMFAALFGFLGRSSLLVVNFLILGGIVLISLSHSLELLRYAGLRNGLEWVGVFVWEAAFIFSSIVLSRDFKRGTHGWAPWVGFLAGLSFVVISNYTGMEDNPAGKIIGVSTPLLLLVFKGVLAHQVATTRTTQAESGDKEKGNGETDPSKVSKNEDQASESNCVKGSIQNKIVSMETHKIINQSLKKYRKKDEIKYAIECALEYEQENGELPTKRKLMEKAGCTDHVAKEALKIIRDVELSQTG